MYADNTLTPKEATRLCALGTLASRALTYSALALAVRHFLSHVIGPSLDVMGASVEMLKYEGLIEAAGDGEDDGEGDPVLAITDAGRRELRVLLTANMRSSATELNKLIVALKFRFMHLLSGDDQCVQADLLVEVVETELARLEELRTHHAGNEGHLVEWLDHDINLVERRLYWLREFRNRRYTAGEANAGA